MNASLTNATPLRLLTASATTALLVACSGCDDADEDRRTGSRVGTGASPSEVPSATTTPGTTTPGTTTPGTTTTGSTALLAAGALVSSTVPDSTVTSVETADAGGWEVQVVTASGAEHKAVTSPDGRTVATGPTDEHEDAADRAEHRVQLADATLDYRDAARRVTAVQSGRITELNLDDHRGRTVWEADVATAGAGIVSVKIDAGTGDVVSKRVGED